MKIKLIKNKYLSLLLVMFLIFGSFLIGNYVYAIGDLGAGIAQILGYVVSAIIYVLGQLLSVLISVLIWVAGYNDFIKSPAVTNGWVIVRDLCNMFFILILLIIAFATILRQENYSVKKLLPKLLIMAVLINFSKTICGIFIDFAQVIMLTFVNSFQQMGGGNLISMLGIDKIMNIKAGSTVSAAGEVTILSVLGSYILALLYVIISLVVITTIIAVLVMRMVMLWIYIVLSPLAYLLAAFPAGQKYASQWWDEFTKNLIVGPVLAFFIWLSFASATTGLVDVKTEVWDPSVAATVAGSKDNIIKFIISIGMLIGGLMVAQQAGGAVGSIAGKGLAWAQKAPAMIGKGMGKAGLWTAGWAGLKLKSRTGLELRPTKVIQGLREALQSKKETQEKMGESKAGAALKEGKLWGALGASRDFSETAAQGFMWHKGWLGKGSVIERTRKRGKINKEINQLQKKLEDPNLAPEKRKDINQQIEGKRDEIGKYKPVETFYADEKRNTMAREKMKFFYDSDNEDYLHSVMMNAMDSGQTDVAMAAYLQMTKAYHDNEALNKTVAREDYRDENGDLKIKKGEFLSVNQDGQAAFAKQYLMGKLGLSEQEALSLVSQSCTISKANRHFALAEGVGVKNGLMYLRPKKEQEARSAGEFRKEDAEGNMRRGNRLAHMGEKQFIKDPKTGETDRVNVVTDLTRRNFISQMAVWEGEVNNRKRFNPNFSECLYKNYLYLEQDKERPEEEKIFKEGERESLVDVAKKIGATIGDSKNNIPITSDQIAWQTLEQGAVKYYSNQKIEIANSSLEDSEKEEKTKVLEKEEKERLKFIREKIAELEGKRKDLPGYKPPKPEGRKKGGAAEPEEEEEPKIEVVPGSARISDYIKKKKP